jgi:pyruvate dehydrogenase (quinone)/pyruvate oxidase
MRTTADVLIDTIHSWGVDVIFGLPGDGINGIMEALRKRQDAIRFVQVRHEESAAFMACSYAKHTGRLGCCLATSGPGGIHLLNGLYDAKLDGQPVLAITGMQFHDLTGTFSQQDVELDKLFENVCAYSARCMGPAHIESITNLACRTALSYRSVTHICIPVDFQDLEVPEKKKTGWRSEHNVTHHSATTSTPRMRTPNPADLERAADLLQKGSRIAILSGRGALGATAELEATAEILGAPIVKALLGKATVPDDSPYTTGTLGLLGTRPSLEVLEDCDTLLIAGSSFPYMEFLPKPGHARGVQIDLDPARIGLRFPVEVGLVGDCKSSLRALLPLLKRNRHRGFLEKAQTGMKHWRATMEKHECAKTHPIKPQYLAAELGKQLADDAMVCCDSGSVTVWWARHVQVKRGQSHTVSGNLASMACGLPYAIAAQIAHPGRQVVAFIGDGAFTMLMGEIATAVKYKLPIKIVIVKNNSFAHIRWEQMVFLGHPEYGCELSPIDFAEIARSCGAVGYSADDPEDCAAMIARLLETHGPAVLEVAVDPNEPPMPASVNAKQTAHFLEALAKGTREREALLKDVFEYKIRELV